MNRLLFFVPLVVADEGVAMLQSKVHDESFAMLKANRAYDNTASMLMSFAQQQNSDDELIQVLQDLPTGGNVNEWGTLAERVVELMESSLSQGNTTDWGLAAGSSTTLEACHAARRNSFSGSVAGYEADESRKRKAHAECRLAQTGLQADVTLTCGQFDLFKQNDWNVPKQISATDTNGTKSVVEGNTLQSSEIGSISALLFQDSAEGKAAAGQFIEGHVEFVSWLVYKWKAYLDYYKECNSDRDIAVSKQTSCNFAQRLFEVDACAVFVDKEATCGTWTSCVNNSGSAETASCGEIAGRVDNRKLFCEQAQQIGCILREVFKNGHVDNNTATLQGFVDNCKTKNSTAGKCDRYNITCPTRAVTSLGACLLGSKPGQAAWAAAEYGNTTQPYGKLYEGHSRQQVRHADESMTCPDVIDHVAAQSTTAAPTTAAR